MSDKNFLGMSTGGVHRQPSSGGKPTLDFRGPQEKGKPAAGTAHAQVGRGGPAGDSADTPNRSGGVKIRRVEIATPQRGGKAVHHGDYEVG